MATSAPTSGDSATLTLTAGQSYVFTATPGTGGSIDLLWSADNVNWTVFANGPFRTSQTGAVPTAAVYLKARAYGAAGSFDATVAPFIGAAVLQALVSTPGVQAPGDTPALIAARTSNRILTALRNGAIVGHRGLGGISTGSAGVLPTPDAPAGSIGTDPENSMSAFLKAYALGLRIFEVDVWGVNGYLMHDSDPRRVCRYAAWTTAQVVAKGCYRTNAGNVYRALNDGTCGATAPTGTALTPVSDDAVYWQWIAAALPTDITTLSQAAFRDLTMTPYDWLGTGYENEQVITIRDLLRELGGKCMFIIEAKDAGGGQAIANALREFNVPTDMALCASFTFSWTLQARNAGYGAVQYASTADTLTPAAVAASGAVGYGTLDQDTWTAAKVAAFHAVGVIVGPAPNLHNKYNRDLIRALGADWIASDEPLYMSDCGNIDDGVWTDQRWPAGMVCEAAPPALSDGGRGVLKPGSTGANGWGFSTYTSTPKSVMMGQFVLPATFKRRFYLQIPTSGVANQGMWMAICCADDRKYIDVAGNYGNAYLIRLRKDGVMDIYKTTSGMTLGSPDATATATGLGTDLATNRCQFELEVSATQVKITNITGGNVTATLTDSTYRGPCMHMGRTQATYVVDTWQKV